MARLLDRILVGEAVSLTDAKIDYEQLAGVPMIVADNVVEMTMRERVVWDLKTDLPNVAPPFEHFWVETRKPRSSAWFDLDHGSKVADVPAWGAAIHAREVDSSAPDMEGVRWLLDVALFMAVKGGGQSAILSGFGVLQMTVGPTGVPIAHRWASPGLPALESAAQEAEARNLIYPLLVAVCFMHCKNVGQREVEQDRPLSKKWEKRHGRPLVRYHVLDIDPMRKVLRDEGGSETHGLKKALHICRGHFATYTEDAPLFGRVTGTFWKPQHVRGSLESGVVVKDYNVKAPR